MGRECPLTHQFTLKTQDLIATKSNKYIRDETVVTEESTPTPVKTIVNSYTVDPKLLFVVDETGNYQFYIDNNGGDKSQFDLNLGSLNEFLIELSSSSEESDLEDSQEEDDEIEENEDYVVL